MNLKEGFSANAGQLFDELVRLELFTPEEISQAIRQGNQETAPEIARAEYFKLKEFMVRDQRQADLLEDGSSDVLLVGLLKYKLHDVLANHPMGRGIGRPSRLAQIAAWYRRMVIDAEEKGRAGTTN